MHLSCAHNSHTSTPADSDVLSLNPTPAFNASWCRKPLWVSDYTRTYRPAAAAGNARESSLFSSVYTATMLAVCGNTSIRERTNTSLSLRASGSSWNGEEWSTNPQLTLPCPAPLRACYGLIMGCKCFPLGVLATKLSAPLCDSREAEWHMMTENSLSKLDWSASHLGYILYFNSLIIFWYKQNTELTWSHPGSLTCLV